VLIAYTGSTPNDYLHAGQQWDSDLGLYYNRARYLNPNTGRFWTMDTYEGSQDDPLSLHKYLYCSANSVNGIDPSGHDELGAELVGDTEEAAMDGAPLPAIARAYVGILNTLVKVSVNQNQIMFYANAALAGLAAFGTAVEVADRVVQRLDSNAINFPPGNFTRGVYLEQQALGSEQGYLGGKVGYIDYFDQSSGLGISFRSHNLSAL
jgi:RHS repeat-associated protein